MHKTCFGLCRAVVQPTVPMQKERVVVSSKVRATVSGTPTAFWAYALLLSFLNIQNYFISVQVEKLVVEC